VKRIQSALIFLLISSSLSPLHAEENSAKHAIGLNAGWVTGSGLSYRHYFQNSFVQATGIATMHKQQNREYLDASLNYGHYLSKYDLGADFYPIATKWLIGIEAEHEVEPNDLTAADDKTTSHKIYSGIGFGVDIGRPQTQGIVISADLFYTATFIGFKSLELDELEFLPSLGLHYNF